MEWVRGRQLGCGAFATVSLAEPREGSDLCSPLMAVKSSLLSSSESLRHEREVLRELDSCAEIIRCFGDDCTVERGEKLYNLFLEYAAQGSLLDQPNKYGGRLPESVVRRYTRTILKGLEYIHSKGFVHCDIKLGNILAFDNGDVKIGDFGLAKRAGEEISTEERRFELRGTPLSMSPESINDNEYEPPCDIWALGCAVVEMFTGKPAWNFSKKMNIYAVIMRIGVGEELPAIPTDLSEEGKDFLEKCFVRDPSKRWSAQMLLNHPFVAEDSVPWKASVEQSPRCPFEFPKLDASQSTNTLDCWDSYMEIQTESDRELRSEESLRVSSPADRLRQIATADAAFDWSDSEGWIDVR